MSTAFKSAKMKIGFSSASGTTKELQNILSDGKSSGMQNDDNHDTCLISESPYRILRVSPICPQYTLEISVEFTSVVLLFIKTFTYHNSIY